ncbi:MAG TPA: tyrosine-type recombinase/integrase [Gemmataceae bacterium]|jgi:integrase|nr:tyrosine-type recombinase/integrase [Gemmataceae bacterium]
MSVQNFTPHAASGKAAKPTKPYLDFPLFPHATGRWAKKIRGRMVYFGPWADPDAALAKYLEERDALHAGRLPREVSAGVTVRELCNKFLNAKLGRVRFGELTNRSWQDYEAACALIIAHFRKSRLVSDLDPEDFNRLRGKLAAKWGPVTLGNVIQRIRVVFKFAWDNGLLDRPVRYGQEFKRPSRKTVRVNRAKKGPKLFTAEEVRRMIDAAGPAMKAMILLGINGGFGNADCGTLPRTAVDLDEAMIDYARPKTGIPRRVPLWPETVEALRAVADVRPEPKDDKDAGLVFLTRQGRSWAKDSTDQTLAKEFGKLLWSLKINGRKGLGFYTLRHTFRTEADETRDQVAVDFVMGHEIKNMSAAYRKTIDDARLRAVAEHVRLWLYTTPAAKPSEAQPAA